MSAPDEETPTTYAHPGDDLAAVIASLSPGDVLGLSDGAYEGMTFPFTVQPADFPEGTDL